MKKDNNTCILPFETRNIPFSAFEIKLNLDTESSPP